MNIKPSFGQNNNIQNFERWFKKMKVKECCSNEVCCVNPETTIAEAAKTMSSNHIGCVPVCDNQNKVVGILTDRDIILRSIACDKDVKQTPVSEIMSYEVCSCAPEEEVEKAEKKMAEFQIRRIPVVENDKIVGILTLGDLAEDRGVSTESVCATLEHICCDSKGQQHAD